MSIFTGFYRWFGGNSNTDKSGTQVTQPSSNAHETSPAIGIDSALQISTVWACVTLLSDTIASLPLVTYQENDGRKERIKTGATPEGKLARLFKDRPNKRQDAMQFWHIMIMNLVLRGNAYAVLKRNPRGVVIGMTPLLSDQVEVVVNPIGETILYIHQTEDADLIYADTDILHIRGLGNNRVGMSPMDFMRSSLGLAISAQDHTTKTFRKNARRSGILMSDTVLTEEQRTAVKNNFQDIVTGEKGELYILEAQFKFDPLGMSPADIQLLESRKFAVQDLARWFGVPSILINDTSDSTSLGSSAYEVVQNFYRLRLAPKLKSIEMAIQEQVLTAAQRSQGITVEFDLDDFLKMSPSDRAELEAKKVQNGLATRNEIRLKNGLAPMTGGDSLTVQSNLLPIDKLGEANLKNTGPVPEQPIKQQVKL